MSKASLELVVPKLLRERIKQFNIPPAPGQCEFERVLIYQIPDEEKAGEKVSKTSLLYKPINRADADREKCPRGVIVSAGLKAMDILHDHGMQIGEMVRFSPSVYTRFELDRTEEGKERFMPFMNVGDIITSEDVPNRLADGTLEIHYEDGQYKYKGRGGKRRDPNEYPDSF